MKAVMYGGGNIGRGFIGALFSQSGYEVVFIDVNEQVVSALSKEQRYPVRFVSNEKHEDVWIEGVTAVHGNDGEAAGNAIAGCDIMATAVGSRALKYIVPNIVRGLRQRWTVTKAPFNIIICENLLNADKFLGKLIKSELSTEEQTLFDDSVGLIEASIGRMVPVQTPEMQDGNPLRVCVEKYGFLPTDKAAFKGAIPKIKNMVPFEPFDFYIKRKLYVHNMGHASCAYLGNYLGLDYIYEATNMPDIRIIVQNAMQDSAMALSEKYDMRLNPVLLHVEDLLSRFNNAALGDTCERVGGDLERKL
ncbi:MAG: mannitol dehydrogenase, partial [Clostridiaceae bacterium]|nr:mannitol dehydrogenase [Clostridiaceae bacterium]